MSGCRSETADESMVREVLHEHGRAMMGYALELTRNRAAAEDVVQEALVRAWQHPDVLENGNGSVRGWLLTVIRHLVIDQARTRNARALEALNAPAEAVMATDHAEQVVDAMVVSDWLSRLSVEHRAVLEQTYLRDRTVTAAAEALGVPPGTVKSRTYYALRALRDMHARAVRPGEPDRPRVSVDDPPI